MEVRELSKPRRVACPHVAASGCAIYAERPPGCRAWGCLWQLGFLDGDERRRPDKLGLMFTVERYGGKLTVVAYELSAGAAAAPAARSLLQRLERKVPVVVHRPDDTFEVHCAARAVSARVADLVARNRARDAFETSPDPTLLSPE
jgi:hypothetical protein